jgi:hypothetical protein
MNLTPILRLFAVLLSLLLPTLLSAQSAEPPRRVLIPVASTQGEFDTNWRVDVTASNQNAVPVNVAGVSVMPLTTATLTLPPYAQFVDVPQAVASGITINVRVHDTTHDADSWGTDVPAVPDTQFRRAILLPAVPADARFRSMLRIYGSGSGCTAIVRLRDAQSGRLLEEKSVPLTGDAPSYAQIPLGVSPAGSRVVEITTPSADDPLIWAFVSITNNVTQQVTLSLPRVASSADVQPAPPALTASHWGGRACVEVLPSEIDVTGVCAFGSFALPAKIDPDGHFETDGSWAAGVGPITLPAGEPAHLSGLVQGSELTLLVQTATATIGPVVVDYGSHTPCPTACP